MAKKRLISTPKVLITKGGRWARRSIAAAILVIVIVGGWLWWHNVHSDPQRVFEAMLANSLQTTAVTRHIEQSSAVQQMDQTIQFTTSPTNQAHASTILTQGGAGEARIEAETISTPYTEYVRYKSIDTPLKTADGKPVNFSKAIGIWGKNLSPTTDEEAQTNGELFGDSTLGVVPFANFPVHTRKALLRYLKENTVYSPDYSHVDRKIVNGRPEYTYAVTMKTQAYVEYLKKVAHEVGLTQLESVDVSKLAGSPDLKFELTVDVWSRQLVRVAAEGSEQGETLSAHGVVRYAETPTDVISIDDLQSIIYTIQSQNTQQ
jgi:hypothetical protein